MLAASYIGALEQGRRCLPAFAPNVVHSVHADGEFSAATVIRANRDAEIAAQGSVATYCYLVIAGCVRTVRLMPDGRRQIGEFLFSDDIFGWESLETHDFSAEAVSETLLRRLPRDEFLTPNTQRDGFVHRFQALSAARIRAGREHVVLLGRKTAAERVASFLLDMAGRLKSDSQARVALPMSRGDMADYLGLTPETVCRQLTLLRQKNVIAIEQAKVVISNRRALELTGRDRHIH